MSSDKSLKTLPSISSSEVCGTTRLQYLSSFSRISIKPKVQPSGCRKVCDILRTYCILGHRLTSEQARSSLLYSHTRVITLVHTRASNSGSDYFVIIHKDQRARWAKGCRNSHSNSILFDAEVDGMVSIIKIRLKDVPAKGVCRW